MRKKMKLKDVLPLTVGPVDVVTSRGTYEMEYIAGEVFGVMPCSIINRQSYLCMVQYRQVYNLN